MVLCVPQSTSESRITWPNTADTCCEDGPGERHFLSGIYIPSDSSVWFGGLVLCPSVYSLVILFLDKRDVFCVLACYKRKCR